MLLTAVQLPLQLLLVGGVVARAQACEALLQERVERAATLAAGEPHCVVACKRSRQVSATTGAQCCTATGDGGTCQRHTRNAGTVRVKVSDVTVVLVAQWCLQRASIIHA
jgi:hypothetical protein